MTPAVSVVVAAYNYGRFLGGALASALGQTFRDLEVILIDDGSTDDTEDVARAHLTDGRLRYLRTDHLGQPAAKNAGVRACRAPLVAFLDADDVWLPHKLERQVGLFRRDPGLGVVYARRLLIDEEGWELHYEQPPLYRGEVPGAMFRQNFVCFSSSVVRREVFDTSGLFDERVPLAIDFDLWLRAALRYRFDYVDEPLVKYRVGHASLSRRVEERLEIALGIMRRFLDVYGGRRALRPAEVRRAFAETYCNLAVWRGRRSRLAALPCYLRALAAWPFYAPAWRGLATLPVPDAAWQRLRRLLGRGDDWSVRKRLGAAPSVPGCAART